MIAALSRKDKLILGGALVATVLAGVCSHERFGPIVAFLTAATALALLATVVGESTDNIGSRLNPGATGVLQSALGNLPELFVCIFSLRAGLVDVVKGALIGSILANSLLVMGLAILLGGIKNGRQVFHSEPPKLISIMMLLAAAALAFPTFAHQLHTPASQHENTLSVVCSVVLLVVFFCTLSFSIRSNPSVAPQPHEPAPHAWPMTLSVAALACAGVGAAFVSEWFVDALKPATQIMGLSEGFTGLVVVAIAGNAIENLVGIQLMMKNKPDYAMSVVLNSSLQIALVLVPVLVLISMAMGGVALTLVLPPLLVAALILAAVVPAFIVFDGESIWLEGVALIGLYAIIAASFWWG